MTVTEDMRAAVLKVPPTRGRRPVTATAAPGTAPGSPHARQLTTATGARVTALEETRDALRVRAERAESDLDAARSENRRLAEQLTRASDAEADPAPAEPVPPRIRTTGRAKKTPATRAPRPEA